MRRFLKLLLRLAVVAVLAGLAVAALSSPSAPAPSPYLSSLSALAGGPAYAATCGNTGCNRYGHCSKARGYNCRYASGECQQTAC